MNKKKLIPLISLAAALVCAIALAIVNVVSIAVLKNEIDAMKYEITALENAAAESMGLQAGEFGPLSYRIYAPEGETLPLVLYLHGAGRSQGNDNLKHVTDNNFLKVILNAENREQYPCIVLAPQCPEGKGWVRQPWGPGIAEDLMGMLEQVCAEYPVDRSRIYITGMSMGGFGTWGMLRAYPDYFAAAVPICGGWDMDDDIENAPVMKNVPIWAFHGALDTAVPVERTRDMIDALKAVDAKDVRYTEYPEEGHLIGDRVYSEPELFAWMFEQVKGRS